MNPREDKHKETIPKNIIIKQLKISDKDKILKVAKEQKKTQ